MALNYACYIFFFDLKSTVLTCLHASEFFQYAQPSFAQPQNNANSSSQFQPMSQDQAHGVPTAGQPWMSSSNHQGAAVVTPQQQPSQQPTSTPFPDPVSALFIVIIYAQHL